MTPLRLRAAAVGRWFLRLPLRLFAACTHALTRAEDSIRIVTLRDQVATLESQNQSLRDVIDRRDAKIALLEAETDGLALLYEASLQRVRAQIIELGGAIGQPPHPSRREKG